ncbi:MAG: glycogen synthase GlgA [Candidatus Margulisbacteria bacterium]|nr:glycogen synthase GlgA [Candidatus Margulisiibacteriota bacterium]MBU1617019.1 glycogen synthase GlgA [Candidatus Margulisiibacteriota bacterium]
MRILYVSSEVVPFAKTGGLADVAGALPKALKRIGHDVRVFMPRYKMVDPEKYNLTKIFPNIYEGKIPGTEVIVYLFDDPAFFGDREGLYQQNGVDYPDNLERFSAFCRAAFPLLKELNWRPDIIHGNDWQSALIIALLKKAYKDDPFFVRTATVYSIHNMAYLGLFPKEKLLFTGLGWDLFKPDGLEFWGEISLSKAGIIFADVISTVSENYAKEIQTTEYGAGLDGLLRARTQDVFGIINGLDYEIWNPATDPNIVKRYSPATIFLKADNKIELQRRNKLPENKDIPVLGLVTRLADQKGLDILSEALEEILAMDCQMVILGTGDPKYHALLTEEHEKFPKKLAVNLEFDAMLAELIYAGADLFMMPSRYEPCGLGQLIGFKYGTIPIVRRTGGLADTVGDFDQRVGKGEGFVFEKYSSAALIDAVKRAVAVYKQKELWETLQKRVMNLDYSWDASAKKYIALYLKALKKIGIAPL